MVSCDDVLSACKIGMKDDHSVAPRLASRSPAKNTGLTYVSSAEVQMVSPWEDLLQSHKRDFVHPTLRRVQELAFLYRR